MQIDSCDIAGPLPLSPTRRGDARGFSSEVFRQELQETFGVGPPAWRDAPPRCLNELVGHVGAIGQVGLKA